MDMGGGRLSITGSSARVSSYIIYRESYIAHSYSYYSYSYSISIIIALACDA